MTRKTSLFLIEFITLAIKEELKWLKILFKNMT